MPTLHARLTEALTGRVRESARPVQEEILGQDPLFGASLFGPIGTNCEKDFDKTNESVPLRPIYVQDRMSHPAGPPRFAEVIIPRGPSFVESINFKPLFPDKPFVFGIRLVAGRRANTLR